VNNRNFQIMISGVIKLKPSIWQIVLILAASIIVSCDQERAKYENTQVTPTPMPTIMTTKQSVPVFENLRNQALNVKSGDLQIKVSEKDTVVYGVVMDWDMPEGVATLIAFSTGDASLYNSKGGGTIGGIGHQKIQSAAKYLTSSAVTYLKNAKQVETTPLPPKDCVGFYLLTNKGKFYLEEKMEAMEQQSSPIFGLFEDANKVITELIAVSGTT